MQHAARGGQCGLFGLAQRQWQAAGQGHGHGGVGQALAAGRSQGLAGVSQDVERAVSHPDAGSLGLPAQGDALQCIQAEIQAHFAFVFAVHHHHGAM